jgi:hypothetical protein
MTNDERAQAYCENESMYGWYCRTAGCPHCGHIPITLHELMNYHDFERVSGTPGQDRWVELRSDVACPSTVGLMHKVTDYTLVAWRPGSRGVVFGFQRNNKPIKVGT